jgi:hypothetical protein
MGDDRKQPWVSSTSQQSLAPDTERTVPLESVSQDAGLTPVPQGRRHIDSPGTRAFSAVVTGEPNAGSSPQPGHQAQADSQHSHPESLERKQQRPSPAREVDVKVEAQPLRRALPSPNSGEQTLQSMMRPDLVTHGVSDARRFLSIERELSEDSAAIKFLEKRLHRLEKDSRVALALAVFALLLAAVAFIV